jgi:hypothetical protein
MNVSEINQDASESPTAAAPAVPEYAQCADCGSAVDRLQRYCVTCGAHQRHVADPATRFLTRATARSRAAGAPPGGERGGADRRRIPSLAVALVLALIPVTLAVGVVVGRSSNNGDSQLIRELSASQAQLAAASRATAASRTAAPAIASAATTSHRSAHAARRRAVRHARARNATTTLNHTSQAPASINGAASSAQKQRGAAIVSKLQHTNGTSYLNQLPSQVVVP